MINDKVQEVKKLNDRIRTIEREAEEAYQLSQKEKQEMDKKFRDKERETQEA